MNAHYSLEDSARSAGESIGVEYKNVPADGCWYPTNLINDHRGKNDGRLKIFPDGQGGLVQNWKTGEIKSFFVNGNGNVGGHSREERERIASEQRKREAKRRQIQDKKAAEAVAEFDKATRWPFFPPTAYMQRKELSHPGCARLSRFDRWVGCLDGKNRRLILDNVLLVPVFNATGQIRNIQYIFPYKHEWLERDKTFISGAELSGCFSYIGKRSNPMFLVEGLATAISLYDDTDCRVYICFSATNLLSAGKAVRGIHPQENLIYCCDNDLKGQINNGVIKANEAAGAIGAKVYIPCESFAGDYNDWATQQRRLENERQG